MCPIGDIDGQLQLIAATTTTDDSPEAARYSLGNANVYNFIQSVAFGTGSGEANKQIQADVSVVNGAPLTLDLEDGTVLDSFGAPFDANNIKGVIIRHKPTSLASSIDLSGNFLTANNLGTPSLAPGNWIAFNFFNGGKPTVAATSDEITFTNPDGANPADIEYVFYGDDL